MLYIRTNSYLQKKRKKKCGDKVVLNAAAVSMLHKDFLSQISYLYGSKMEQCKCHFKWASWQKDNNNNGTNTKTKMHLCHTQQKMSLDIHKNTLIFLYIKWFAIVHKISCFKHDNSIINHFIRQKHHNCMTLPFLQLLHPKMLYNWIQIFSTPQAPIVVYMMNKV